MNQVSNLKKIGDYLLKEEIGKGSFATVFRAIHLKTNEEFAAKQMSTNLLSEEMQSMIQDEIKILKQLNHENIIQLYDQKKTARNSYLIFEYCHLGDLEKFINTNFKVSNSQKACVQEKTVKQIIYQVAQAFGYLRERKIVHRDLKLANILINKDYIIKIADFGFAKYLKQDDLMKSYVGSPITMAPEILSNKTYDERCDIWSIGIIMYKMLTGDYPFIPPKFGGVNDLLEMIQKTKVTFPSNIELSDEVKELIQQMLILDPKNRMNFEQFFQNKWVKSGKAKQLEDLQLNELQFALKSSIIKKTEKNKPIDKKISDNTNQTKSKVLHDIYLKDETRISSQYLVLKFREYIEDKIAQFERKIQMLLSSTDQLVSNKFNDDIEFVRCSELLKIFVLDKIKDFLNMKSKIKVGDTLIEFKVNQIFGNQQLKNFDDEQFSKLKHHFKEIYQGLQNSFDSLVTSQESIYDCQWILFKNLVEIGKQTVINEFIVDKNILQNIYVALISICDLLSINMLPELIDVNVISREKQQDKTSLVFDEDINFNVQSKLDPQILQQYEDKFILDFVPSKQNENHSTIDQKDIDTLQQLFRNRLDQIQQDQNN